MNYIEVSFVCRPSNEVVKDVLSALIAEIGFESFVDTDLGVIAYIQEVLFDKATLDLVLSDLPVESSIEYTHSLIEGKDWNEEWEKNYFEPLVVDNRCVVRSTFHKVEDNYEYEIIIDPKMAFGTGHHQTTELMMLEILKADFQNKNVLDMGCGTAILAILASKQGAKTILAIDIDKWAFDNAMENLKLNSVNNVSIEIGGAELLKNRIKFDIVLANINRNILLNDIQYYAKVLEEGGSLYMSGFYVEDIPTLEIECNKYGLHLKESNSKDNWAETHFILNQ